MEKKTVMCALVLVVCFSACIKAQNYDSEDDFRVAPLDGGKSLVITGYRGNKQFINIPPSIGGIPVTGIGEEAFAETEIVRITIPSGITFIDYGAFALCYFLTSVTIPSSVTSIENSAFASCESLTSISIPSGVTFIGSYAFSKCIGLTSITIPASVTSVDLAAFEGWTSSQTINVEGHANQASADAAWGSSWRMYNFAVTDERAVNGGRIVRGVEIEARINYRGR